MIGVMEWFARSLKRLYFVSLGLYAASFALPAVINSSPTPGFGLVEIWGWQAALMSVQPPGVFVAGPSNVGYATAALLIAFGASRPAIASSVVALLSMAYCGVALPSQPGGGPIRWPGGHLGPGYYAWIAAGIMMLVCGVRAWRESQNANSV
jgi:hypothetical protein